MMKPLSPPSKRLEKPPSVLLDNSDAYAWMHKSVFRCIVIYDLISVAHVLVYPLVALYAQDTFRILQPTIGLVIAVIYILNCMFNWLVQDFGARWGYGYIAFFILLFTGIGTFVDAYTKNPVMFLGGLILTTGSFSASIGLNYISSLVEENRPSMEHYTGLFHLTLVVVCILSPILGAMLYEFVSPNVPFLIVSGICLGSCIGTYLWFVGDHYTFLTRYLPRLINEIDRHHAEESDSDDIILINGPPEDDGMCLDRFCLENVVFWSGVLLCCMIRFSYSGISTMTMSFYVVTMVESYNMSITVACVQLAVAACGNIVATFIALRVSRRHNIFLVLFSMVFAFAASICLGPFKLAGPNANWILMFMSGLQYGFAPIGTTAILEEVTPEKWIGVADGLFSVAGSSACAMFPLMYGLLGIGLWDLMYLGGTLGLFSAAFLTVLYKLMLI